MVCFIKPLLLLLFLFDVFRFVVKKQASQKGTLFRLKFAMHILPSNFLVRYSQVTLQEVTNDQVTLAKLTRLTKLWFNWFSPSSFS